MEKMWEESENRTPLICFLSMGSDPTDNIERLAKTKNISKLCLWIEVFFMLGYVLQVWFLKLLRCILFGSLLISPFHRMLGYLDGSRTRSSCSPSNECINGWRTMGSAPELPFGTWLYGWTAGCGTYFFGHICSNKINITWFTNKNVMVLVLQLNAAN